MHKILAVERNIVVLYHACWYL